MTARIPELRFLGWFLWTMVGADDDAALDKAGTYLIARFPDDCPSVVDIVDERIFYVGETHGRTRTLRARLTEFGRSAGFGGDQERGHYAAWGYPDAFPEDRGSRRRTDSSKVYVALCPFPGGDLPIAARGVFPGLVESLVLWQYANAHRRLPALNNSGANQERPIPDFPAFDAHVLEGLLAAPTNRDCAARLLCKELATSLGYSPNRTISTWTDDGWSGVKRPLGGKWWLSIGWPENEPLVGVWVTNGAEHWFGSSPDEAPVGTAADLRARLDRLWLRWHSVP